MERSSNYWNIVDEFTREALVTVVDRNINADATVAALDHIAAQRGAPEHIRCDNGPELTAYALRDWCRFSKTQTSYIDPGAPWQNPYVESLHSRLRDELLDVEEFSCLTKSKSRYRRLARGLQQQKTAFLARDEDPSRLRCRVVPK